MPAWIPIAISLGQALLGGHKATPTPITPFQPYQPAPEAGFDEDEYRRRLREARARLAQLSGGDTGGY